MESKGIKISNEILEYAVNREKVGNTAVFAAIDGKIAAIFSIADQIRSDAAKALAQMRENGVKK
jgi:hypothetical protein